MNSKYYLAHNAGSRLIGGQSFEIVGITGGTAIGVFEAKTEELQVILDKAVADPSSAVESITPQEYEAELKKKVPSLNSFKHTNYAPVQMSMRAVAAVVVEGGSPDDDLKVDKLASVDTALASVGKVEVQPQPEESVAPKKPKK